MLKATIDIYGLNEIKDYISSDRISKQLALGVAETVLQLHTALKHSVFIKYREPNDLEKAFVRNSSIMKSGKGFIEQGLIYQDGPVDLSRFPYTKEWGNLNEPKVRKGFVHTTTVVRNRPKVVHGKYGYGGFTNSRRSGGYAKFIYERMQKATWIGKERAPLRVLQSLNLVDMATIAYTYDEGVKKVLNNVENIIIDNFIP